MLPETTTELSALVVRGKRFLMDGKGYLRTIRVPLNAGDGRSPVHHARKAVWEAVGIKISPKAAVRHTQKSRTHAVIILQAPTSKGHKWALMPKTKPGWSRAIKKIQREWQAVVAGVVVGGVVSAAVVAALIYKLKKKRKSVTDQDLRELQDHFEELRKSNIQSDQSAAKYDAWNAEIARLRKWRNETDDKTEKERIRAEIFQLADMMTDLMKQVHT